MLSLEHRPSDRRSRLIVLRADRPGDGPVAVATLRHHVPMTFHGAYKASP
ncbi:carotenoid oxygenase family protein [Gordonia amicalis]|nr:carotenoid oxygenase family protein [Gordonia amicalis]